jgi:hypothetical protein
VVNDDGTSLVAADPFFARWQLYDYRLLPPSICRNAATTLHPTVLPAHDVTGLFRLDRVPGVRVRTGGALDVGAYEDACPGDINVDFVVDLVDLSTLLAQFGNDCVSQPCAGDIDGSQTVDLTDLAILLSNFGSHCDL